MSELEDPFSLFDGNDSNDDNCQTVESLQEYCDELMCYSWKPCSFHQTQMGFLQHGELVPNELRNELLEVIGDVQRCSGLLQFRNLPEEASSFVSLSSKKLAMLAREQGWRLHYRYQLPVLDEQSTTKNTEDLKQKVALLPSITKAFRLLHPWVRKSPSLIPGAHFGAFANRKIPKLRRIGVFLGYPTQSSATSSYAYETSNCFVDSANAQTNVLFPEFETGLGLLNEPTSPFEANCAWYYPTSSSKSCFQFVECFTARDIDEGEELLWSYGEGYQNNRKYHVTSDQYLAIHKSDTGMYSLEGEEETCAISATTVEQDWHASLQSLRDLIMALS